MLKKSSKSTQLCFDSHDCKLRGIDISKKGWQAALEGYKESMAGFFQHVCPSIEINHG